MSKSACRCKKAAECEECPEWIFTFADLVMLMMGFFVILWVLKPNPDPTNGADAASAAVAANEEWLETVASIRGGFGWVPDPSSSDPVDQAAIRRKQRMNGPGEGGKTNRRAEGAPGTDTEVTGIRPGKDVMVGGRLLFNPGEARLTADTVHALESIVSLIRGHRNIFLVKGHTSVDDLPDSATAQQKMDLSIQRAQAVADYLISKGVEPEILRVQGCSTFEPVARRAYTDDVRILNRRVEITATTKLVEDMQDRPTTQPTTADSAAQAPASH